MNKLFFAMMPWLFAAIGYKATAQEVRKVIVEGKFLPQANSREITIRKKGDKNTIVSIEFKDDNVLINGKALVEFKDDEISINNRKIVINGEGMGSFDEMERQFKEMEFEFKNLEGISVDSFVSSKSFLGVVSQKDEKGAIIIEVSKESAAEKAGLLKGDIISKINDIVIDGPEKLAETVGKLAPNTEVKIGYKRDGKNKSVNATLQERKENNSRTFSITMPGGNVKSVMVPRQPKFPEMPGRGFDWNDEENEIFIEGHLQGPNRPKLGLKIQDLEEGAGVKVLEVEAETAAAKAGLQKDDIITEIAGVKVENTDDAREQLMVNGQKNAYSIRAKRNNADITFDIKIPKKLKTINL
jgi:serine protease Do